MVGVKNPLRQQQAIIMRMPPPSSSSPNSSNNTSAAANRPTRGDDLSSSGNNRSSPAGSARPPRPLSELNKEGKINFVATQHSVKQWCSSATTLFEKADVARLSDDVENAYILLSRAVSIVLELVPSHPQFNPNDSTFRELRKGLQGHIEELERLKARHIETYNQWLAQQKQNSPTASSGAGASVARSTSSNYSSKWNAGSPSSSPRAGLRSTATQNNQMAPAPYNPPSSSPSPPPKPSSLSYTASNSGLTGSALPSLSLNSSNTAPPATLTGNALPSLSLKPSTMTTSNTPPSSSFSSAQAMFESGSKPKSTASSSIAPYSSSLSSSMPSNDYSVPTAQSNSSSTATRPTYTTNGSSFSTNSTTLNGISSSTFLQSGSHLTNPIPSHTVSQSPFPMSMTAAELHSGLVTVINGAPKSVMLIDLRPMESYVQGHIKWRRIRGGGGDTSINITTGLIHIEPDWVHAGVKDDYIEHCLRGFASPDDPRVPLFDSRAKFDLVIVYDESSTPNAPSPSMSHLAAALTDPASPFKLRPGAGPALLTSGFEGWEQFIKCVGLRYSDWIEIGDGFGGEEWIDAGSSDAQSVNQKPYIKSPNATPKTVSYNASSTYSSSANPAATAMLATSTIAPVTATETTQPIPRISPSSHSRSSSLRQSVQQFDNPFINFAPDYSISNTFIIPSVPTYPSLQSKANLFAQQQQQQNLHLQRSASNPGMAARTEYSVSNLAYPNLPKQQSSQLELPSTPPIIDPKSMHSASMLANSVTGTPPTYNDYNDAATMPVNPYLLQTPNPYQPATSTLTSTSQLLPPQQQPANSMNLQSITQTGPPSGPPPTGPKPVMPPSAGPTFPANLAQPRTDSLALSPKKRALPPPIPPKPSGANAFSPNAGSPMMLSPSAGSPSHFISFSELGSISAGVTGLRNLGNTCFLNSTLQCLTGTVPLTRYFLGGSYKKHVNRVNPMGTKGVLVEEYSSLVRQMWSGQDSVVAPYQFKEKVGDFNPQFQGNDQHDSQEFLAFILDAIHEDLNIARTSKPIKVEEPKDDETIPDHIRQAMAWNYYKSTNWSVIVDLFQGQLKSKLTCLTCSTTSTTYNPFMYLSLPIPAKNSAGVKGGPVYLEECLEKYCEPEILDGDDAWMCTKCKVKRPTRKELSIVRLPAILLVHLKRFFVQGPFKNKIETYVEFPVKGLDLTENMPQHMREVPANLPGGGVSMRKESFAYDLYGISNHMGTLTSGHYTAQVYNGQKKQWYLFDDSRISVCDEESIKSKSAYILFYVRKSGPGSGPMTSTDWWAGSSRI